LPPAPKKWKWRSPEERIAILDVEIERVDKVLELLPNTYCGAEGQERHRLVVKLGNLEIQKGRLIHGKRFQEEDLFADDLEWLEHEKTQREAAKKKLGMGFVKKRIRKRND